MEFELKLLAIVSDILKNHFLHSFSCDTDFLSSWDEVAHTQLKSYDLIVAMGSLIEDKSHALALWRVASEIRYFKVPAIFVDVSMQASKVLSTHYPISNSFRSTTISRSLLYSCAHANHSYFLTTRNTITARCLRRLMRIDMPIKHRH